MEKFRPILAALKKHHFWLLTGICAVVMLYCWNSATHEIEKQFAANKMKVDGEFSKIQTLSRRKQYPNPKWEEEVVEKGQEVAKQIELASRRIVKRQQPALNWPDTFSSAFIEVANKQSPLKWPDEAIAEFQLVMPEEVKRLRTIVDAAEGTDQPGLQWNNEDYQYILSAFTMKKLPAKKLVMRMRTRFWIFESLAKIVAATNADAADKFNLPIHNLEVMAVGGSRANFQPAEWRVAGIADGKSVQKPPKLAGYDVWPVRLQVRMDLKYLNRMLSACANTELPMDVTGVRFDHPNRTIEVEQKQPEPRERFRVPGGFGGGRPLGKGKTKEKTKPEPTVPARGTLVEITGFVYIADEEAIKKELAKPKKGAKTAAVARPASLKQNIIHNASEGAKERSS